VSRCGRCEPVSSDRVFSDGHARSTQLPVLVESFVKAKEGHTKKAVNRASLHDEPDEIAYWLTRLVTERVAAVEILRQRVFGGSDGTCLTPGNEADGGSAHVGAF
jgi:hypothetical protein